MSRITIQRVRLDPTGRLRVRPPASSEYPFIHRDASSVRWDGRSHELHVLEAAGLDALAEFQQIVRSVHREYGDALMLSSSTEYADISSELVAAMTRSGGSPGST